MTSHYNMTLYEAQTERMSRDVYAEWLPAANNKMRNLQELKWSGYSLWSG